MKVQKSEILNTQGQGHSFGCLWTKTTASLSKSRFAMGSTCGCCKTQEERDGGRLPAGGETPVIADSDGEQGREVWALSAGREVPTAVA